MGQPYNAESLLYVRDELLPNGRLEMAKFLGKRNAPIIGQLNLMIGFLYEKERIKK